MAMSTSKPHVWVKTAAQTFRVKVACPTGYTGFSFAYNAALDLDIPNNRISIRCILNNSGVTTADFDLTTNADYVQGMKVTVKVMEGNSLRGLMTVKPIPATNFSILADSEVYKPYCWMEYVNATLSKLHVNVKLPVHRGFLLNTQGFIQPDIVNDDFVNHRRTITCNLVQNGASKSIIYDEVYVLDASSGYDPVLEDITMVIKDNPGGGQFIEESKATSTESEADASGGGGS